MPVTYNNDYSITTSVTYKNKLNNHKALPKTHLVAVIVKLDKIKLHKDWQMMTMTIILLSKSDKKCTDFFIYITP